MDYDSRVFVSTMEQMEILIEVGRTLERQAQALCELLECRRRGRAVMLDADGALREIYASMTDADNVLGEISAVGISSYLGKIFEENER